MLKKRIVFTLLLEDGDFVLSRNFNLQKVGGIDWLREFYDFDSIAKSIDELILLDVSRSVLGKTKFSELLREISRTCFVPIGAGGGVRSVEDVKFLLNSGADKVIVNKIIFTNPELVRELVDIFGAQSIVASIDYKKVELVDFQVFSDYGRFAVGMSLRDAILHAQDLGVGEIYLTSIDLDGTGRGLQVENIVNEMGGLVCPVIVSGGAGTFLHIADALKHPFISAVSTANLFNFMGDNLTEVRRCVRESGTPLAQWVFHGETKI